jgi:hypothetical protein
MLVEETFPSSACVFDCRPNCLMVKLYSNWLKENVHNVVGSSSSN